MSEVQRCQCGAEVISGATFCVQCGMPVVQNCPYPACSQGPVPLRTDGLPTSLCPFCGQELLYCPRSGKLHSAYESVSTAPGCEGVPLQTALRSWNMAGATPSQSWSVESAKSVKVPRTPRQIDPMEKPATGFPIAPLLALGGAVVYSHGASLRSYRPGTAGRQTNLSDVVPPESWRLMAWRGKIYCILDRAVDIVDASAWLRERSFQGAFVAQTHTDSHWVGALLQSGALALQFVKSSGDLLAQYELAGSDPSDFPRLAADGHAVFAGSGSRIFRADETGCRPLCDLDGTVLHLGVLGDSLLAVVSGDGIRWVSLDFAGGQRGSIDLDCRSVFRHPVLMDGFGYVIDASRNVLMECRMDPPRLLGKRDLPALTSVVGAVGCWNADSRLLVVAGLEGDRGGRILVIDTQSAQSTHLTSFSGLCKIGLISIGDKIAVSTSASYENTLRVFDLGAYDEH